jgi:hypothetical protein
VTATEACVRDRFEERGSLDVAVLTEVSPIEDVRDVPVYCQ